MNTFSYMGSVDYLILHIETYVTDYLKYSNFNFIHEVKILSMRRTLRIHRINYKL